MTNLTLYNTVSEALKPWSDCHKGCHSYLRQENVPEFLCAHIYRCTPERLYPCISCKAQDHNE